VNQPNPAPRQNIHQEEEVKIRVPMRHVSSRELIINEGRYDLNIAKLPIAEEERGKIKINPTVYMRSFENEFNMTKL
jgi:hypothetical protein